MAHGQPHEEAEHAQHHAADPFDKRVAMTMVIIAALLAGVRVLGHRTHNDTLGYQIKAGVANTEASNQWNFFQSKKMREVLARFEAGLQLQEAKPGKGSSEKAAPIDWDNRLSKLTTDLDEILNPREKEKDAGKEAPHFNVKADAEKIVAQMKTRYDALLAEGLTPEQTRRVVFTEESAQRYNQESRYILERAKSLDARALEYQEKSEHKHHQAAFFDLGELGVELALVLCSVAILSKRAGYWYAGGAVAALGVVVLCVGFFV